MDLERRLEETFGLRDCRVADTDGGERSLAKVGDLGARWLVENVPAGGRLGVSWGRTLRALVSHVPHRGGYDVEVVPLVGGLPSVDVEITGEELVRDLARRLGGRFQRLPAPATLMLVCDGSLARALLTAHTTRAED
ncbi:sugar-binding domain-containing protein [Gandjariella thermophila]|uniref:Sugar-binding domain-containing protein n=1 Tax=Gandjariella thermophila TaxID=1931992 RepID=A0A4D4JG23_9PSEU|nr:sugar-binding domain-containing protein [Gandjariella thermophila]GDY33356.1 hypothetical protein GTS_49890 [Gandjariella thermophila]